MGKLSKQLLDLSDRLTIWWRSLIGHGTMQKALEMKQDYLPIPKRINIGIDTALGIEQNMTTNEPTPSNWKSVIADSVVYDPITGNYSYKEQTKPDTYNEFWTPLGQPRTTGRMTEKVTNKEKSPRKEKKKKPKEKRQL